MNQMTNHESQTARKKRGAAGEIVLAWGVFEFASAYQSRDTAQQTDSLKKVVAGILMCLATTIINLLK